MFRSVTHNLATFLLVALLFIGSRAGAELNVAGLWMNNVEQDQTLDIEVIDDDYYVRVADIIQLSGLTPVREQNRLLFDTPMGTAVLDLAPARIINGEEYLNFNDLKKPGIRAYFNKRLQAAAFYIPWLPYLKKQEQAKAHREREADYPAPEAGLSSLRTQLQSNYDFDTERKYILLDLELFGALTGGSWGTGLETIDDEDDTELHWTDLYWNRYWRKYGLRLGTATSHFGSNRFATEFTGIQFGYSNKQITPHIIDASGVTGNFFDTGGNYTQDIRGKGPPGGIAELRIDGKPVARLRIGYDGRYAFNNLNLGRYFNRNIEIYLYEFSLALPPVKKINISRRHKPEGVSTKEVFMQFGAGYKETEFSDLNELTEQPEYTYFDIKYGLNNDITVELGLQHDSDFSAPDTYAGLIASWGKNILLNFGVSDEDDHSYQSFFADVSGDWEQWDFRYLGRETSSEENNRTISIHDHTLNAQYRFSPQFTAILVGHYYHDPYSTDDDEHYLLPGGYWYPRPVLGFSLIPGDDGYSFNANWRIEPLSTYINYNLDEDDQDLSIRYSYSDNLDFEVCWGERFEDGLDYRRATIDFQPDYDPDQNFSFDIGESSGHTGYRLQWRKNINQSTQLEITYDHEYAGDYVEVDNEYSFDQGRIGSRMIMLTLTSSLGRIGKSWRFQHSAVSTKQGAVGGSITDTSGTPVSAKDLHFTLGRRHIRARGTKNGEFSVEHLAPGVYPLVLRANELPIEYSTRDHEYLVEIAPASTTRVDIVLEKLFGVSGRILTGSPAEAKNISGKIVKAIRDGNVISEGEIDEAGFYQVLNLPAGEYELTLDGIPARHITITDDFLFGVDL